MANSTDGKAIDVWRDLFLQAYAEEPNVSRAAKSAGIQRNTAYKARERDPELRQRWDDIREGHVDSLEAGAFQRAIDGTSGDSLTIFMLKQNRPDIYQQDTGGATPEEVGRTAAACVAAMRKIDGDDDE